MSRSRSQKQALRTIALSLGCVLLIGNQCGEFGANESWPSGATLLADTDSLDRLLGRLAVFESTPLADRAASIRASLPDCPIVEGRAESGRLGDALQALTCRSERSDLAALERIRAGSDLAVSLPIDGEWVLGALSIQPNGDVDLEIRVPDTATKGLAGLVLPGSEAPGAAELSRSRTLIHARVRPIGGVDLAALVPAQSQGAQLFRLKSDLFAGVVLDAVWELAVYLPEAGHPMPRTALALNFSHRTAAVAAMEKFISSLQESWPVTRTFFQIGSAEGACLLDLKLMPDLAPCYVATERALVVGWNPASLRKALDDSLPERGGLGDDGGAVIHLERFAEADLILSRALSVDLAIPRNGYPWRRVVATGTPVESSVRLQFRFETGDGS
jgi:hypothetical protein